MAKRAWVCLVVDRKGCPIRSTHTVLVHRAVTPVGIKLKLSSNQSDQSWWGMSTSHPETGATPFLDCCFVWSLRRNCLLGKEQGKQGTLSSGFSGWPARQLHHHHNEEEIPTISISNQPHLPSAPSTVLVLASRSRVLSTALSLKTSPSLGPTSVLLE